jgi:ribosomal protein S18 acetylase RimI-like enzyme
MIRLAPATRADLAFVRELHGSDLAAELDELRCVELGCAEHGGEHSGGRVGFVRLRDEPHALELWELTTAARERGRGIGTSVVRSLQARAAAAGKPSSSPPRATGARATSTSDWGSGSTPRTTGGST